MSPASPGPLLPYLLAALAPMKRTGVKQLLTHGRVFVNGVPTTKHDFRVKPGDVITLDRSPARPPSILPIVYEDDDLIVVDKPAGLLTVATDKEKLETAFMVMTATLPERPAVVHRLDRETSGLLLFAKSPAIRDELQAAWNAVEKTYIAVVEGVPRPKDGTIDNFLTEQKDFAVTASQRETPGSKRAISRYRTLKTVKPYSLVEVVIETGRKHQIRVHLAGIGCPVVGDDRYGAKTDSAKRMCLHAQRLAFNQPTTGQRVVVESPVPNAFLRIV